MLTISELRRMRTTLTAATFEAQLGPFVIIQKPPDEVETAKAMELAANSTAYVPRDARGAEDFAVLFEFDQLQLATLPPVGREDVLSVGRLPDNELVIDDSSVSKRHAQLLWQRGRCVVRDLGSTNGTYLNEHELGREPAQVHDTDILKFGKVRFAFLLTSTLYRLMGGPQGAEPKTLPYGTSASARTLPGVPELGPEPRTQLAPMEGKLAAVAEEHRRKARAAQARPGSARKRRAPKKEADDGLTAPDEPTQLSRVAPQQDDLADPISSPVAMPKDAELPEHEGGAEVTRRMLLRNPELDVTVARPMFTAELAAELRAEAEAESLRRKRSVQRGAGPATPPSATPAASTSTSRDAADEQRFDPPKKR